MSGRTILYEQPLNEHIRVCLRLEHLFSQVQQGLQALDSAWAMRSAVTAILEMINVLDRSDLKAKLLKELKRQASILSRLRDMPGVDSLMLSDILDELSDLSTQLHACTKRIGQNLRDDDVLNCARQHMYNPGGGCQFDAPRYHFWLNRSAEEHRVSLETWLSEFQLMQSIVDLLLHLTRHGTSLQPCQADAGFYEASFSQDDVSCQLVRVLLKPSCELYPEISASKHQIYIRFLQKTGGGSWQKSEHDVDFELACCVA